MKMAAAMTSGRNSPAKMAVNKQLGSSLVPSVSVACYCLTNSYTLDKLLFVTNYIHY